MKLNRTGSNWNELERNKINENWGIIEGGYNDVVGQITDEVVGHLIDSAKLNWKEPVEAEADLPKDAEVGETRMVRESDDGVSHVYRYNGEKWELIQEIDATLVNEVDRRLSAQLADTDDKFNVKGWELNSKARKPQGVTVFISDDGMLAEYTVAKQIFESEGVPQCIAVPSGLVGQTNRCTKDQLIELQDLGWEIMAHSVNHPYNPLIVDMPDEQAEAEFRDSIKQLRDMGLKVESMSYVGGNYTKREYVYAKKYYRAARNSDTGYNTGINYSPMTSHELKTVWLDPKASPMRGYIERHGKSEAIRMRIADMKVYIDKASETNGLLIISTHFNNIDDDDYQNMYREVIQYAKSKTKVTTLSDALNKMGNIVEVGTFSDYNLRIDNGPHFVLGTDGLVSGSATLSGDNQFTPDTDFKHFPFGITYTPIFSAYTGNIPEGLAGVLVTYKMHAKESVFNRQEFINYYGRSYRRMLNSDNNWGDWRLLDSTFGLNFETTPNHPLSYFPDGVSVAVILSNNPGIDKAPRGKRGTLITYKAIHEGSYAYSFQEYHVVDGYPGEVYKRFAENSTDWGRWISQKNTYSADDNTYDTTTTISEFPVGITQSIITTNNPNIINAPEQERGTLVTHRVAEGSLGYSFQEYHAVNGTKTYKRRAVGSSGWGPWVKIQFEVLT